MVQPPNQPSDLHPALTWDRLTIPAKLIRDRRIWVVEQAVLRESSCGIGYRAWDLSKLDLVDAAAGEHREWLSIVDASAKFAFGVGGIPVRFLRGDSEEPLPPKYAVPTTAERLQMEFALGEDGGAIADYVFRLMVQADEGGRLPLAVYFVAGDGTPAGEILYAWKVPISDSGADMTPVVPIVAPKPPVTLPPLFVQTVAEVEAAERAAEEAKRIKEELERIAKEREAAEKGPEEKGA